MTITYTAEVATCTRFGCFIKLLARWRGSIYKLVWMDLLLFLFLYYGINLIYIYILNDGSQRIFESVVYYCATYSSLIPLSFVLGFYVNLVMTRWWEQYITIPWPDSIAVFVSAHVHGQDEGGRVMRRTVMRYVCLCLTIVFTMISPCVKKRFPKMKNLVDAGLLLDNEKQIIETMDCAFPKYPKHWMPIIWAASIITRARREGRIRDDFAVKTIIDELNSFRGRCGTLMYYDFISIPLVYTQVVTIAVYSFFVCSLLAHQWTKLKQDTYEGFDFCVPIFITMEFFFYMGWLKVAETLINPFGEDDDDFEVNWMIDRNLQVSYLIVDEMHHEHPELVKDQYWDEVYPNELPYDTEARREQPPESSTAKYGLDDSPMLSSVKVLSATDNTSIDAKSRQNSIVSIRSERFKEAFQRFSQISEEEVAAVKPISPSRQGSVSDVESIQRITSYRPTMSSMESIILKLNTLIDQQKFDTPWVPREGEEIEVEQECEVDEYDVLMEETEEVEMASESLYESDSDSDPFERLRLERQQERIQRTNAFLQKYFGYNFRVANQPMMPDTNKPNKAKKKTANQPLAQSTPMAANDSKNSATTVAPLTLVPTVSSLGPIESNLKAILNTLPMSMPSLEFKAGQLVNSAVEDTDISKVSEILAERTQLDIHLDKANSQSRLYVSPVGSIESNLKAILSALPIGDQFGHTSDKTEQLADPKTVPQPQTATNICPTISETLQSQLPIPPLSNMAQTFQLDPETAEFSDVTTCHDAAVSPMGSITSFSTADTSELDDWEVVTSGKSFNRVGERR